MMNACHFLFSFLLLLLFSSIHINKHYFLHILSTLGLVIRLIIAGGLGFFGSNVR